MMTPLKDTLGTKSHQAESGADQTASDAGHLRADAVSLELPVKVHGSRVTEVVRGTTPLTRQFEEQAVTMIVFPQGGVLRMSTAVTPGQMVVLTNLKTGQDAICRVIKVRSYATGKSYVEIEFTNRQPGYWGVYFPSDSSESARKTVFPDASVPSAASRPDLPLEKPLNYVPPLTSAYPAHPVNARAAEELDSGNSETLASKRSDSGVQPRTLGPSHFVALGSHEDVQPAASATSGGHVIPFHGPDKKQRAIETHDRVSTIEPPLKQSPVPAHAYSVESSHEGVPAPHARHSQIASSSRDEVPAAENLREGPKPGRNWLLVAAAAAVIFAAVGAWTLFFRTNPLQNSVARAASTPVSQPTEANLSSNPVSAATPEAPAIQTPESAHAAAPSAPAPAPVIHATDSILVNGGRTSETSAPKQQVPSVVSDMFGALNAHPVSTKHATEPQAVSAPSLDAAAPASANGALDGVSVPSGPAPLSPPPTAPVAAAPAGVVRVGGQIRPPKLVHSVVPEYPDIARSANVEGTVVLDTTVDEKGKVLNVRVISGPTLLRQAAIDALRQWRYEPSRLDGQPITVQMTVSIQFKR